MKKPQLALLPILCCLTLAAWAQPSNDECANPIKITDVTNFCSANAAYTNVNATASSYGPATCFGSTTQKDVWFSFEAKYTDVTITVRGATAQAAGGTLRNPQVALYQGNCSTQINQLECRSAAGGTHIAELYQGGLFIGTTYLIRIQGAAGLSGTFQLCINNYNPPVAPSSDCPKAAVLCDKSPFVVKSVTGAGSNITEMNDASCFANGAGVNFESNSTWFVWTCSKTGTLEFTLKPLNAPDDLDFVVYRLPNGPGNCAGKQVVRCMASGDNNFPSPCMGPTGLRANDKDNSEDAGCTDTGDDAWLSPLDMVAGQTYALVVNNFTSTGNGFSIEFGGSGEFRGPEAKFTTEPAAVCLGTPVKITDNSSFALGTITEWKWSFGEDAVPKTATGKGPHNATFNVAGDHPVALTVKTNLGCQVTTVQNIKIFPDVEIDTLISEPNCNGSKNGAITINNITAGTPPYQYSWDGGAFGSENALKNIAAGTYKLIIQDANKCQSDFSILVKELELKATSTFKMPSCNGRDDGSITFNVTNGIAPVQFNWGSGFIPQNTQGGFKAGIYTIPAQDASLCKGSFVVTVTEPALLTLTIDTMNISCNGANDGMATAKPSGGTGPFAYRWSNGQSQQKTNGLSPGTYSVTISDANSCTVIGSTLITQPGGIMLELIDVSDLKCNGLPTGEITVRVTGGRGPYQYTADGKSFVNTPTITGLAAGSYRVLVKDASGCTDTVSAVLIEPDPIVVAAFPEDTLVQLGFPVDISTFTSPRGRPVTFEWLPTTGLSCIDCGNPQIRGSGNIRYVVKITDADGCTAMDTIRIRVGRERPVYVPNVFSPDQTGPNDRFTVFGGPAVESVLMLRVFDRWGSLVFERGNFAPNDLSLGWDGTFNGKKLNQNVFAYYCVVRFIDGTESVVEGDVTLVR